eukprot:g8433.t1
MLVSVKHGITVTRPYGQQRPLNKLKCRSIDVAKSTPLINGRFSTDQTSYTSEFVIRGYEVGPDRRASIQTIANLLQENATNHAVAMWGITEQGFAADASMVERNLVWAMIRLQIRMLDYPKWSEKIEIETWLQPQGRAAAKREFIVKDTLTGSTLGYATSVWVCIHNETRRLARIPDDLKEKCAPRIRLDRGCTFPDDETGLKLPEIDPNHAIRGPVRFAGHMQIDMNNHINNVAYLTWALDLLPDAIFESYQLREVEIDFKAECNVGSRVEGLLMEMDTRNSVYSKEYIHNLFIPVESEQNKKMKELMRLRSRWIE